MAGRTIARLPQEVCNLHLPSAAGNVLDVEVEALNKSAFLRSVRIAMFIDRRCLHSSSSVRSGIWPRADVAPDGARERNVAHSYKHCAPNRAGKLVWIQIAQTDLFLNSNSQFERIVTGRVAQPAMVARLPSSTLPETAQPWLVALPFLPSFFQIENC